MFIMGMCIYEWKILILSIVIQFFVSYYFILHKIRFCEDDEALLNHQQFLDTQPPKSKVIFPGFGVDFQKLLKMKTNRFSVLNKFYCRKLYVKSVNKNIEK